MQKFELTREAEVAVDRAQLELSLLGRSLLVAARPANRSFNHDTSTTIVNVAINDVLASLKAARRDALANIKCFWGLGYQRLNVDGYIYIHYAVPPYPARNPVWAPFISARLATVGWVPFPCATRGKHNAEFTKGG